MISTATLSDVFVEVTNTLVAEFDLVDFLHHLSERAVTTCDSKAAGILLVDHRGTLRHMAASTDDAQLVDLVHHQSAEGPSFDCFHSGNPVINSDLSASSERWPEFAPQAIAAGFGSVHAFPLRLRDSTLGVMNIFSGLSRRFEAADVRVVQVLADLATIAILQERSIQRAEALTEQLQGALNSRITIEQAKGALSRYRAVSTEDAFDLMRVYARTHQQGLRDVAMAVINAPASVPTLTSPW